MVSGKESAVSLAKEYLRRIAELDQQGPSLRSVLDINPDALAIAAGSRRRAASRSARAGALHGIPVLLKDNIDTHDRMMTTAGSLALVGSIAPQDSFVAKKLREAGAIILGKTNLSEWANFRGTRSSSGWSGRGGQTHNPYALDRNHVRLKFGFRGGRLGESCPVAVGTENRMVAIISPLDRVRHRGDKSRRSWIGQPLGNHSHFAVSRPRPAQWARSGKRDAAILLGASRELPIRKEIPLQAGKCKGKSFGDYTQFLDANGLRGASAAGKWYRKYFPSAATITAKRIEAAIAEMKRLGAIIVDPADDISLGNLGAVSSEVLHYEFKAGLNVYLASLGPAAPVRTLQEIIEFNERNKDRELPWFGQETFLKAQEKGPLTDKAYLEALEKCRRLSRAEGIDGVMDKHQLDCLIAPSGGPAGKTDLIYGNANGIGGSSSPAAVAGYPNITVPAGEVFGLPFGLSFFGRAYSEPTLLKLAFAFEQATMARKLPRFLASIG